MIAIYRAANITDAHLIRQMLEAEGIPAFIQGEYLQGAVGELPANTEILVQVGDQHAAAARAIVGTWENAEVDEVEDDAEDASQSAASPRNVPHGMSVFTVLMTLLLGTVAGALIVWTIYRRPSEGTSIEYDRNHDNNSDQIVRYDFDGLLDVIESDDDFDGSYERMDHYHHNQPQRWTVDNGMDRNIDSRGEYSMGRLFSEEWLDQHGNVIKSIRYDKGLPVSGKFDSDGDGKLDITRRYDARGEIVASEPLLVK